MAVWWLAQSWKSSYFPYENTGSNTVTNNNLAIWSHCGPCLRQLLQKEPLLLKSLIEVKLLQKGSISLIEVKLLLKGSMPLIEVKLLLKESMPEAITAKRASVTHVSNRGQISTWADHSCCPDRDASRWPFPRPASLAISQTSSWPSRFSTWSSTSACASPRRQRGSSGSLSCQTTSLKENYKQVTKVPRIWTFLITNIRELQNTNFK